MEKAKPNKKTEKGQAKDVDEYLAALPQDVRKILQNLRKDIKAAAPDAEELISYQIPTFKYHGPLVHFVARKNYISFIVVSRSVIDTFKDELKPFDTSGTTIHFSAENPLPSDLVRKIVELRSRENEERDASE